MRIKNMFVSGFRSLQYITIPFSIRTVLLGANGVGKTNVLLVLGMLNKAHMSNLDLDRFVRRYGGADKLLSPGHTEIKVQILLEEKSDTYVCDYVFKRNRNNIQPWVECHKYAPSTNKEKISADLIKEFLRECDVYNIDAYDTKSGMRRWSWDPEDSKRLQLDGWNLAPVLHRLSSEYKQHYENINHHLAKLLPMFEEFHFDQRSKEVPPKIRLMWKVKDKDLLLDGENTSDATARLMALVTLLNLPKEMLPNLLLLDEIETGLHSAALVSMGHMILKLMHNGVQVIVSAQSHELFDVFSAYDIVLFDTHNGQACYEPNKSLHG